MVRGERAADRSTKRWLGLEQVAYTIGPIVTAGQQRIESLDLGLIVVALLSIGTAAVFVEYATASAVALAFWRCSIASVVLAPSGLRSSKMRGEVVERWPWILLAGVALGLHFATFLASLEKTSTATAVTLLSTAPVFVIAWRWLRGRPVNKRTIVAAALALTGVIFLAGADFGSGSISGAILALIGGASIAIYLLVGDHLRSTVPTASYVAAVYGVAAVTMIPVAVIGGRSLTGFDRTTWLAIAGLVIGPQLGGHTTFNYLLGRIGSVLVSLVILADPIVSSALTWLVFGEVPPAIAWIGTPLVLLGLALAIRDANPALGS